MFDRWPERAAAAAASGAAVGCLLLRCALRAGGALRSEPQGPLAGVRVVECAVNIAGPWSCTLLAEMGAEVVKVECMDLPDSVRGLGTAPARGMGGMFCPIGRGKRSVILNMKTDAGRDAFLQLIDWADVFLQNFRPGAAERMGVGYEVLRQRNSGLIYLSSSGFGQTGPNKDARIYDPIIQCASGYTDQQRDRATKQPQILAQVFFDKTNAMLGAQAITAALLHRDQVRRAGGGGGGQHIQLAMIDTALWWMWIDGYYNHAWDDKRGTAPRIVDVLRDKFNQGATDAPSRALSVKEAVRDAGNGPHLSGGGRHLLFGGFRTARFPAAFSGTPTAPRPSPPMLGEHTVKVLRELGVDASTIAAMLGSDTAINRPSSPSSRATKQGRAAVSTRTMLLSMGPAMAGKAKVFGLLERLQGGAGLNAGAAARPATWQPPKRREGPEGVGGALRAVRVLELSTMVAGPVCGCVLGDEGADVVKVELKGELDPTRGCGQEAPDMLGPEMGAMYLALNRNKRSVVVNQAHARAGDVLAHLARWADVVVADAASPAERLLPAAACRAANPDAVYVRIVRHPKGELGCQEQSGMASEQALVHKAPTYVESMICEKTTGLYAATAACSALYARNRGKGGQVVEVDMLGSALHFSMIDIFMNEVWAKQTTPKAFPQVGFLYGAFFKPAKDGRMVFALPLSDKEWLQFVQEFAPARVEELTTGDLGSIPGRVGNIAKVEQLYMELVGGVPAEDFITRAKIAEAACSPALTRDEALSHPQVLHNQSVQSFAVAGRRWSAARPAAIFSGSPAAIRVDAGGRVRLAPIPGEHTEEVLRDVLDEAHPNADPGTARDKYGDLGDAVVCMNPYLRGQ